MGLEGVEIIIGVEERFRIAIPDEDAAKMATIGDMARFVHASLPSPESTAAVCATSRVFYLFRRALTEHLAIERGRVRPDVRMEALFPKPTRRKAWNGLRTEGIPLPHLTWRGRVPRDLATVGETVAYLAHHSPTLAGMPIPAAEVERAIVEIVALGLNLDENQLSGETRWGDILT